MVLCVGACVRVGGGREAGCLRGDRADIISQFLGKEFILSCTFVEFKVRILLFVLQTVKTKTT